MSIAILVGCNNGFRNKPGLEADVCARVVISLIDHSSGIRSAFCEAQRVHIDRSPAVGFLRLISILLLIRSFFGYKLQTT